MQLRFGCKPSWGGEHKKPSQNPGVTFVLDQRQEGPARAVPALTPLPSSLKRRALGASSCRLGSCWGCTKSWSKIHPKLGVTSGVSPQEYHLRAFAPAVGAAVGMQDGAS